jgi:hypothetical protein
MHESDLLGERRVSLWEIPLLMAPSLKPLGGPLPRAFLSVAGMALREKGSQRISVLSGTYHGRR